MYVLVLIAAVIFFMPTPTIKPNPDQQSDIDNTKSHSASGSDVVNFIHQVDILVLFIFNNKLIHNKKKTNSQRNFSVEECIHTDVPIPT